MVASRASAMTCWLVTIKTIGGQHHARAGAAAADGDRADGRPDAFGDGGDRRRVGVQQRAVIDRHAAASSSCDPLDLGSSRRRDTCPCGQLGPGHGLRQPAAMLPGRTPCPKSTSPRSPPLRPGWSRRPQRASSASPHGRRELSGLVWADDQIVTAEECLANDEGLSVVLADGRSLPAEMIGRDPSTDVALLRADTGPQGAWAAADRPAAGAFAWAVGRGADGPTAAFGAVAESGPAWTSSAAAGSTPASDCSSCSRRRSKAAPSSMRRAVCSVWPSPIRGGGRW